jgi:hypothetical protein
MADELGTDLDRAPARSHGKIKERFRWAAALWRSFPKTGIVKGYHCLATNYRESGLVR